MSKIKFLPKKILQDLDLNQTYPKSLRHGDKVENRIFNDSNTVVFNNNENISLPTTANISQLNKLGGIGFRTDVYIQGKTNQNASSYVTNLINNQKSSIEPFIEDNIPENYFYENGTKFLTNPLRDKNSISIKLPIPKNEYFSGDPNKIEYLTLSQGTSYDGVDQNAGWIKSEITINELEKNLNFKNAITDPFGNIVNHNLSDSNTYNKFINEIHSQSLLRENTNDNIKINLSQYINKPFVVEKVSITLYGSPSNEWLNSKTKLFASGTSTIKYSLSGSAITAILAATNSGYFKTFFSGTIVSSYDTIGYDLETINGNLETLPYGFERWATPTFKVSNTNINKISLEGPASFSNGAIQYKKSSNFILTASLLEGDIYSTKKIGRSNLGFNSGYSKFENEYSLPYEIITSINEKEDLISLLGGFYNHVINNYKSHESPCILNPNDSLILTLSKYIGDNDDSFIIGGNELEPIETENGYEYKNLDNTNYITIHLYGSYLKEEKEIHDLYSQNTVTDCVHEIIGNDIVVDQYNCYPVDTLSGSLINNSGLEKSDISKELGELGLNFPEYQNWYRISSYNKNILTWFQACPAYEYKTDTFKFTIHQDSNLFKPFFEQKNKLRYTQTYDNNEYYYDSLTPSLDDILSLNANKIMNLKKYPSTIPALYDGLLIISNLKTRYIDGVWLSAPDFSEIEEKFHLSSWQEKFPFDDEFNSCRRLFKENTLLNKDNLIKEHDSTHIYSTLDSDRKLNTSLNLLVSFLLEESDFNTKYLTTTFYDSISVRNTLIDPINPYVVNLTGLTYQDYKKVIFGSTKSPGLLDKPSFKMGPVIYPLYLNTTPDTFDYTHYFNIHNNPPTPVITFNGGHTVPLDGLVLKGVPVIRGWKYGLYNGIETQTKMHWNMKHYGHFRDLLEQRPFTTFYYLKGKDSGVSNPAVTVDFVDPITLSIINPELTDSSNLNYDASSVRPFFDGESRNRTYDNYVINNPVVYTQNTITQI